jgi:hypothetical protein
MALKIYTTNDWMIVKDNEDTIFAGHSISAFELKDILEEITYEPVACVEVTQEEMEVICD